jgi:hypothetical protein
MVICNLCVTSFRRRPSEGDTALGRRRHRDHVVGLCFSDTDSGGGIEGKKDSGLCRRFIGTNG